MEPVEDKPKGLLETLYVVDTLTDEDFCAKTTRTMFTSRSGAVAYGAQVLDIDGVAWVRVGVLKSELVGSIDTDEDEDNDGKSDAAEPINIPESEA